MSGFSLRGAACALALAQAVWLFAPGAAAQNSSMQELLNRVDRLQRELSTLQRQVYRGETPPPAAQGAAPPPAGTPADTRTAARNSVRITQLETELSRLTGRIEEVDHRLRQIQERLDKLVADVDHRLTALEGGTPPAEMGAAATPPAPADTGAPDAATAVPRAPRAPGAPPRALGTIPGNLAVTEPRGPAPGAAPATSAPASALPEGTPQEQYEYALSLMLQDQDFDTAETALRAFVGAHPEDQLAGNAQYWLGETYYVRNRFEDAAFAFAEAFQKYPKGTKAADSLLKLGMSLAQLGKRKEACTAYERLLQNFPQAGARLKARVEREQRRSKCL